MSMKWLVTGGRVVNLLLYMVYVFCLLVNKLICKTKLVKLSVYFKTRLVKISID